jgi:hypothetical protein
LHDAARALQFVRSKAAEWNIDEERIAAAGALPVRVRASGWPTTMIWRMPTVKIQSPANPPACGVSLPPLLRPHWIPDRFRSGFLTASTEAMPSGKRASSSSCMIVRAFSP